MSAFGGCRGKAKYDRGDELYCSKEGVFRLGATDCGGHRNPANVVIIVTVPIFF